MAGLAFGLLLLAGPFGPALAQVELLPGYDDRPALGPARAKGAVIWNHGLARLRDTEATTPWLMDEFQAAGWDVFRLQRRHTSDRLNDSSEALIAEARGLRARGYRRIVSAGQSFGGWISFAAAGRSSALIEAIVATAPAAHGEVGVSNQWRLNADNLYGLAEALNPTRVVAAFFDGDSYDPGGRGEALRRILARKGLPHLVIDRPAGFTGHGAGQQRAFARLYGACIVAFVEAATAPPVSGCTPPKPALAAWFPLPRDMRIEPPAPGVPPALARLAGAWYGWYTSGRETALVVERVAGADDVRAIYAVSQQQRNDKPGAARRAGRFDSATGVLRFAAAGEPTTEYRLRPDGRLDLTWTRADGAGALQAVLERVEGP